jgi:hypothetical protein
MTDAQITLLVIVPIAFIGMLFGSMISRRRQTPLVIRPIEGYRLMPLMVDESVESDRPLHFSFGASALGQESTLAAIESANIIYFMVRRMAFGRQLPLVTLADPMTLAVASDTLRKAFLARNNLEAFRINTIAWYPQGERSMAFAAGVASHMADVNVSGSILLGQFGAELAILGETSLRRNLQWVANSTTLEGQAVAFAMSDTPIVGEELFVGSAYIDPSNPLYMGTLIALDVLRWTVILGILLAIVLNAVD